MIIAFPFPKSPTLPAHLLSYFFIIHWSNQCCPFVHGHEASTGACANYQEPHHPKRMIFPPLEATS